MKKELKYITKYMHPYTMRFIIVFLIIIVTTAIVAFYPYIFGKLVDVLFYAKSFSGFARIVLIYFIIFIINQILHYCLDIMVAKLKIEYSFDIKKSLFHKVLTFKSKQLSDLNTGEIIYRINNDAEEVLNFIYSDIFYGISAFLDFSMCFGLMAYINISLALVSLLLVVITLIITNIFKKQVEPLYNKLNKMTSNNQNWLFELLNGMRDIRLMNAVKHCKDKYLKTENEIIDTNYKVVKKEMISDRINAAVHLVSSLVIYVFAAIFIAGGSMTLGSLIACIDYFKRMVLTLDRMYLRVFRIARRMISVNRLIDIENCESEEDCIKASEETSLKSILYGDIVFDNVSFSYSKDRKILDGLNLHIKAGEKVAIVGRSGEGKSTITSLLCRLYDYDAGSIKIDGHLLNEYSLHSLRDQIGLVNQSATVFNNTVRYNMVFTNDKSLDDIIWQVLQQVKMKEVIENLPDGLDTVLSTDKSGLSGGQKQRLTIARAYLKKPKILVFDESTSALDESTESDIISAWSDLFPNCTILIISHRLSTIINCDRIAYLENGKVAGCDRHEILLANCDSYRIFFSEQSIYTRNEKEEIENAEA